MIKKTLIAALSSLAFASVASAQYYPTNPNGNSDMNGQQQPAARGNGVRIQQGQAFSFAVPAGWQVTEDGSHAVVTTAPDGCALTVMTGNAGVPNGIDPIQFAYTVLSKMNWQNLQIGQARQAQPINGCQMAAEFEFAYAINGVPCRGMAKVSVAPIYGQSTMIVTFAASTAEQWAGYANWLPKVAESAQASNGAAFGARGVMSQNINLSTEQGRQDREYRDHSRRVQDEMTRDRNASNDRNNESFREGLGNTQKHYNPYTGRTEEQSANNSVYWVNTVTGQVVGSPDANFDPRTPSDINWQRMPNVSR